MRQVCLRLRAHRRCALAPTGPRDRRRYHAVASRGCPHSRCGARARRAITNGGIQVRVFPASPRLAAAEVAKPCVCRPIVVRELGVPCVDPANNEEVEIGAQAGVIPVHISRRAMFPPSGSSSCCGSVDDGTAPTSERSVEECALYEEWVCCDPMEHGDHAPPAVDRDGDVGMSDSASLAIVPPRVDVRGILVRGRARGAGGGGGRGRDFWPGLRRSRGLASSACQRCFIALIGYSTARGTLRNQTNCYSL